MPRKPRRRAKRPQTRGDPLIRKIHAVVLERLAAQGFDALSIPEVAAQAGVNKTSLYRRWPTKTELVQDALSQSMGHHEPPPETGDLRRDLLGVARNALQFIESPQGMGVLRTLLAGRSIDGLASTLLAQAGTAPRRAIAQAIARGELRADADIELALSTVAGALMHRIFIEHAATDDGYLERLIALIFDGLRAPRGRGAAPLASPRAPR